jgi:hypothetical protein
MPVPLGRPERLQESGQRASLVPADRDSPSILPVVVVTSGGGGIHTMLWTWAVPRTQVAMSIRPAA